MANLHVGIVLPDTGPRASPEVVRRVALAADKLGFHSVWGTDHLIVGSEAEGPYGLVLDPMAMLAWVSGLVPRPALGTSILILPIHHPIHVAKQGAFLQDVTGGRFILGVGVGWHEPEFRYLGYPFRDRGARTDEAIDLIRALWAGEESFQGRFWSFADARFGPAPQSMPEIWIGGVSEAARRRARERGDAWHPNTARPEEIRSMKQTWDGRVVPRISVSFDPDAGDAMTIAGSPERVRRGLADLLDAGADGFVVSPGGDPDRAIDVLEALSGVMSSLAPGTLSAPDESRIRRKG